RSSFLAAGAGEVTVGTVVVLSRPTFRLCPRDKVLEERPFHSIISSTLASYCLAMENSVWPWVTWWVIQPPVVIVVLTGVDALDGALAFCSATCLESAGAGFFSGFGETSATLGASVGGAGLASAAPWMIKACPTLRSFP